MATITASLTLASPDLLTNALAFSTTNNLTTAGTISGLSQTSGLARTNFTNNPIISKTIYRSDDALTDGANKVYLKNLSTTVTEFFTVYIDQKEMGRLYAGDWAFFPWIATAGTKEVFEVTVGGTVAVNDRWTFDGVTTNSTSAVLATFATQVDEQFYPNWTTARTGAAVVFTARRSGHSAVIDDDELTGDTILDMASGDLTMVIDDGVGGVDSSSDIQIVPSVVTTMDLEHMLFKQ